MVRVLAQTLARPAGSATPNLPSAAPAPKASGRVSAKHELRSSRKAPRESPNARSLYF